MKKKIVLFVFIFIFNYAVFSQISMRILEDTVYVISNQCIYRTVLVPVTLEIQLTDTTKSYVLYNFDDFAIGMKSTGDGLTLQYSSQKISHNPFFYQQFGIQNKVPNLCLKDKKIIDCSYKEKIYDTRLVLSPQHRIIEKNIFLVFMCIVPNVKTYYLQYDQSKLGARIYLHNDTIMQYKAKLFLGSIKSDTLVVVFDKKREIRKMKKRHKKFKKRDE